MINKVAGTDDAGKRFDKIARAAFPQLPLSQIFSALRTGKLTLNGHKAAGSTRVQSGDVLAYHGSYQEALQAFSIATALAPVDVVYEDTDFVIVNKRVGQVVHGDASSLQVAIEQYVGSSHALSFRPSPCHRLDKNTSGLVVCAKTASAARSFADMQQRHSIKKYYVGLVQGQYTQAHMVQHAINYDDGRAKIVDVAGGNAQVAKLRIKPLWVGEQATLCFFELITGRKHQIRVQMAHLGHPLCGDKAYGSQYASPYALHAWQITGELKGTAHPPASFITKLREYGCDAIAIQQIFHLQ
jgi:23S rRNA pseudouridine955/2504/2580 synthase